MQTQYKLQIEMMTRFIQFYTPGGVNIKYYNVLRAYASNVADTTKDGEEEFRVLDLVKKKTRYQRRVARKFNVPSDRANDMSDTQDWGSVWPGPRSFHPASVPLPLRQGYVPRGKAPPSKYANAELMKIPNFLHLTPPVVKRQCEAIKQFCTPWPKQLDSEEKIEQHYPLEVITSDYCHASPSIRNPLARIVSIRTKLATLNLNESAKDKFRRLVGERYNEETDLLTIITDRCPVRKQNLDYAMYLLTACYHESFNVEDWEKEKSEADMEVYHWERNASKRSIVEWYLRTNGKSEDEIKSADHKTFDLTQIENVDGYKKAVSDYINLGEEEQQIEEYRKAVQKLFGLPEFHGEKVKALSASG